MYKCAQGHDSETADYCSVCGADMTAPPPPASRAAAPLVTDIAEHCPTCRASKVSGQQVFCEVCGHNFRTGQTGMPRFDPLPAGTAPAVVKAVEPPVSNPAAPTTAGATTVARWDVIVEVDAYLFGTPNPAAPAGRPKQTFSLFESENIIGRATTGTRVQIPVTGDEGVSRRHALLLIRPGPNLAIRDLGSANGTMVNGVEILPGVETTLQDGDQIAIGAWTRLTIQGVRA